MSSLDRWQALLPSTTSSAFAPTSKLSRHYPSPPRLIGRLPSECYILILQYLPIPDLPSFARGNKAFGRLVQDDRVWKFKLAALGYKGPGEIDWRAGVKTGETPTTAKPVGKVENGFRDEPEEESEDEFGDFSTHSTTTKTRSSYANISNNDVDDGFGDFQDFSSSTTNSSTPAVLSASSEDEDDDDEFGGFSSAASPPPPSIIPKSKSAAEDLMMLFDDDEVPPSITAPTLTPPAPVSKPPPPKKKPSIRLRTSLPPSSTQTPLSIYQHHISLLLPYYTSLLTHTTSSLLFTSSTLTPRTRALLLTSLLRFVHPYVAPTRSLPQRQLIKRNIQSCIDFFESALLAEFERCDDRVDEEGMREIAGVLWGIWEEGGDGKGGGRREVGQWSLVQVFVGKREVFYEQSWDPLKNLVKVPTPSGSSIDGIDFTSFNAYTSSLLSVLSHSGSLIARIFPPPSLVLIYFLERLCTDVLSDYISLLLSSAQTLQQPLFLLATAATFGQCYRLVEGVLAIEPKWEGVTKERAEDVIFRMFEQHMDEYLSEETEWIRQVLEKICDDWDSQSSHSSQNPSFLSSSNPAAIKRNVLSSFTKVLLLPATIIPKTAALGLEVLTSGANGVLDTFVSFGNQLSGGGSGGGTPVIGSGSRSRTPVPGANGSGNGSSVVVGEEPNAWGGGGGSTGRPSIDQDGHVTLPGSQPSPPPLSPTTPSHSSLTSPNPSTVPPPSKFAHLPLLLSLDTSLSLLQSSRDSLSRLKTFSRYPGVYGKKVRETMEEVFIILLQVLGEKHLSVGFKRAEMEMRSFRVEEWGVGEGVAPLVMFFELVHVADTMGQMVDVYFEKEMAAYIDKKDFLNAVVREKKKFETALDDAVAQGLNAGVNILMNQVEHIIFTHQSPRDFNPDEGADLDLQPTKACSESIEVLKEHCGMLKGSTDKQILEVFNSEVGIRLHGILLKHLKHSTISIPGGFQLISDLNFYHSFISSLRQPQVTAFFTSLKILGEIFIIDSPKDLGMMCRDVQRYDGTLSTEDLYELVQRRADWKRIEKEVERGLFGFKKEDCVIS